MKAWIEHVPPQQAQGALRQLYDRVTGDTGRALEDARAAGRDHLTQTEEAVRTGREARPDLTASEILATVRRLQQS